MKVVLPLLDFEDEEDTTFNDGRRRRIRGELLERIEPFLRGWLGGSRHRKERQDDASREVGDVTVECERRDFIRPEAMYGDGGNKGDAGGVDEENAHRVFEEMSERGSKAMAAAKKWRDHW
ncbi:hypothetical protein QJS10_CPB17g01186 [Acorus calamus]|uniref:Uncharacterized protein n=1 Tax=Acorus calamus TaxID=4465 RepID=A0AAV9CSK5_ACOCL|nr:hypothetical protein QJS10_CPB17g01186 [Acorus calamus]